MLLLLLLAASDIDPNRVALEAQMTLDYQRLRGVMVEGPPASREAALSAFRDKYIAAAGSPELTAVLEALKAPTKATLPDLLNGMLARCEAGNDRALCTRVGRFYQRGAWPLPDIQEYEAFLELSVACSSVTPACVWAGDIAYAGRLTDGRKAALEYYEDACRRGWVEGCTRRLERGKQNQQQWRERACKLGDADSCAQIERETALAQAATVKKQELAVQARRTRRNVGIGFAAVGGATGLTSLGLFLGSVFTVNDIRTTPAANTLELQRKVNGAQAMRTASLLFLVSTGVFAAIGLPLIFASLGDGPTLEVTTNGTGVSLSGTF